MIMFERVRKLCKDRKISINDLENALGYSKNTLYRLKTQTPGSDKLEAIADYFDVSTDYLLGRTEQKRFEIETLAAHHDGDEWTDEELADIEAFKQFVRMRKEQRMKE